MPGLTVDEGLWMAVLIHAGGSWFGSRSTLSIIAMRVEPALKRLHKPQHVCY